MRADYSAIESVLNCVAAFRSIDRDIQLGSIVAFLHVCEHEGVTIMDLAHHHGFSESSMSRYVHCLASRGAVKRRLGLVEIVYHPDDGRRRLVYLTAAGRQFKEKLHTALALKRRTDRVLTSDRPLPTSPIRAD